jgi:hypothetical protein
MTRNCHRKSERTLGSSFAQLHFSTGFRAILSGMARLEHVDWTFRAPGGAREAEIQSSSQSTTGIEQVLEADTTRVGAQQVRGTRVRLAGAVGGVSGGPPCVVDFMSHVSF